MAQTSSPTLVSALGKGLGTSVLRVLMAHVPLQPCQVLSAPNRLPEVSLTRYPEVSSVSAPGIHGQCLPAWDEITNAHMVAGGRHVLPDTSSGVPMALEDIGSCKVSAHLKAFGH